jgi:hypothetical protein
LKFDGKLVPVEVEIFPSYVGRSMSSFIKTYSPEEAFVVFYRGEERDFKVKVQS